MTTTAKRTRLSPEARRAQLLQVAVMAFERLPLDTISFETLAPEAGVSPALLRHYFGTRRELFVEAVAEVERRLAAVVWRDRTHLGDPRAQGYAMLDDYLHFVETHPWAHRVWMAAASDPETAPVVQALRHRFASAIINGPFDEVPPLLQLRVFGVIGFFEAVVTHHLNAPGTLPRAEVLRTMVRSTSVLSGEPAGS